MKIALALIVKGSDEEAVFLNDCLKNVHPYVDGIFITSTYAKGQKPHDGIDELALSYGAHLSYFEWVNDFSKARNFNFSQVPKKYDYILWCDADDVFRGLGDLQEIIKQNPTVDAFAFNYLYSFDKYKNPNVVHKKTQVVRNDGCVEWIGALHEDFKENRQLNVKFVSTIERMHMTTEHHSKVSQERNLEISKEELKGKEYDPRMKFNLGNSYFALSKFAEAKEQYVDFLKTSNSDDEKYIIHQRLSSTEQNLGNKEEAIKNLLIAIGLKPELPDAYNNLGYLYFEYKMYDNAEKYLLIGLVTKPKYHSMIVYNPRDYDYNPMMALAKVYFNKNRPDLALPMLRGCSNIYPEDMALKSNVEDMEKESKRLGLVLEALNHIESLKDDKEKIAYTINKLPEDLQSHPAICRIRNKYFVKKESTGKDIAYYCGQTHHEWNPEMAKTKGIGGSEEAVINLSKEWVKLGYNVTVFNNCGSTPMTCNGVEYKPYWYYNANDKYDITVLWRSPILADYELNTGKIIVDLHDVVAPGEFTEKRLKKIDKIFVKTNAHRILFPNIPDEKMLILPNGQDFELFDKNIEKDPYLLVNTSSPDRSMDVLPKLFKKIKARVPQARLKWAYGWEIFDNTFANDKAKMEWRDNIEKEMKEAGIENMGRLSQSECAKLYMEGRILAYPSEFYEIDCISVKKAQACGCKPITTDFAAFKESNKYGINIPSKKTVSDWSRPYQFSFGIEDEKTQNKWVDAVVEELNRPMVDELKMKEWALIFDWWNVAIHWTTEFY